MSSDTEICYVTLDYAETLAKLTELEGREVLVEIRVARPDVIFANPCRFLQAPLSLVHGDVPSVYFCDEPRRADYDTLAKARRRGRTSVLYAPLYSLQRRADRSAAHAATQVLTNSHYTAQAIRDAYGRDAWVCPMGVSSRFTPQRVRPTHLLTVGTLIPGKGHDLVIRSAAAARTRWPVQVVAPRADRVEVRRLEALAATLGVSVTIRVGISEGDLVAAYRAAFATLYLAEREPLGLVSLEAQACGSPVIVAREGGLPETIVENETGWSVPRDPDAVARRLDLLEVGSTRDDVANAAARRGRGFRWADSARVVQAALEEACASRS